ncbi:S-layer homology domain-containing protein [Patescibacteria group bacterium]
MLKNFSKILAFATALTLLNIPIANASTFTDIPYTHPHSDAISYLQSNEMVQGYEDNTYRPDNLINRVEFLKIVLEGTNVPLDVEDTTGFNDIDENQWYGPYLKKAKKEGWVQGYPDNTFRPSNAINKVEALKILGEVQQWDKLALGEVPEAAFKDTYRFSWYSPYVHFAKENELLFAETDYLYPGEEISRAYMAEIVYRSIVQQVILYKPGQTAEDKIQDVQEVETPSSYEAIPPTYFDDLVLDKAIPNTYYLNEVYEINGSIISTKSYETIFVFLAKENGSGYEYIHIIGEVTGDDFRVPLLFTNPGKYQLGIIPGTAGESNIFPITVLDGIPEEGSDTNTDKATNLDINFDDDRTNISWDANENDIFRVYFYQDDTVHYNILRNAEDYNVYYKGFKNFKEGEICFRVFGARTSSLEPVVLENHWSQSNEKCFDAVTHNFKLSLDDSISYTSIPELISANKTISVSGRTDTNIFAEGAVITPSGSVDKFIMSSTDELGSYFGNDIIEAGSKFSFSYKPTSTGTYILEINDQGGSAVLNIPVYVGDIIPIIPDFFDLQDPLEKVDDFNLTSFREELLNYINVERIAHGLGTVEMKNDLNNLSQNYSDYMDEENFFSHIGLDGSTPDTRRIDAGVQTEVGENLAHAPSVYFAHKALMRSAIHRENVLDPQWTTVGLGITLGSDDKLVIVEEFSHNPWSSIDLINFENQLKDWVNNYRTSNIVSDSKLTDLARSWSQDMIDQNFFSFTSPSGINLIETVQNSGVTSEGKAFILKEGSLNSIFDKLMEDSDITLSKWRDVGIGLKQDEWSNLYVTVIYTE